LDKLGFRTNKERRILHGIEEVIAYIREYTEKRPTLGYDIDGLVFKVDNIDDYDVLGYTAKDSALGDRLQVPAHRGFDEAA
jgi:DNA ligase (NAD+)